MIQMKESDVKKLFQQFLEEKAEAGKGASGVRQSATKPSGKSNKPLHRIQVGNVTASVFPHDYEKDGVYHTSYNVAVDRGYTDKDGNWQSSKVFRVTDLHKVITAVQKAYEAVALANNNGKSV